MATGQFTSLASRALTGLDSPCVAVEVHVTQGLPQFSLVGLPEASVKESKDRVRSALISSGFQLPPKRITVNLAPADLPKQGSRYDLALALGVLIATGQMPPMERLSDYEFYGELGLNGDLRPVSGLLPSLIEAHKAQRMMIVPYENLEEASVIEGTQVYGARSLLEVCAFLIGEGRLLSANEAASLSEPEHADWFSDDLADIHGQPQAKRVLELCASGGHSLLMVGPPGAGKSMLASRLLTLLPPLSPNEAQEVASIRSIAGKAVNGENFYRREMISPHHSATAAAMIGGGSSSVLKPGAISLAHHSVLFLDELPEFDRSVLEALREPLETKQVDIVRVNHKARYPANIQLICAMNPSPSGFFPDDSLGRCTDTPEQIQRYVQKISGPLMDRIDCHLEVAPVSFKALHTSPDDTEGNERSAVVRARVVACQARQRARQGKLNAELSPKELIQFIALDASSQALLERAVERLGLSARGYHRVLRIALTLADMSEETVAPTHIAEALSYRSLDKRLQ